ncbi:hypothetical protein FE782_29320 [Paenibacillus antri]|uniref:Uncharacterized protein n=1 Tax=Paenibacillus antri TaxID=2582848 RepID=A0A5R9G3E3_9BACL|nr:MULTISPECIES: hypothetical protein [Paenibacillus]TLS48640.1 hypothetical protein FE782_29320 [Paenibacillus antri]HZG76628.1 hypothetical protein [Paenibacillus sp.]
MRTFIEVQERIVPVYSDEVQGTKKIKLLSHALKAKSVNGRKAIKQSLDSLISIEIVDSDAILHTFDEQDSIALSLY